MDAVIAAIGDPLIEQTKLPISSADTGIEIAVNTAANPIRPNFVFLIFIQYPIMNAMKIRIMPTFE